VVNADLFGVNMKSRKNNLIHSQIFLVVSVAVLALFITTGSVGAMAQDTSINVVKNIVLVHGAFADGSSWSKVILLLEARGFHVVSVQIPLTSLADDVATTERAIAQQDGPVVLVGHSYGGAVITEAGNDPKVARLVFIAAFAPDTGESISQLTQPFPTPPINSQLTIDSAGFLSVTPQGIAEDFAQDTSETEKRLLTATQGPLNVSTLFTPIGSAAWRTKPSWFAVASDDRTISPDLERTEAKVLGATTITVDSSHVVMISHPLAVAGLIEKAAKDQREVTNSDDEQSDATHH
jgi:pimeloyl-ACP methyl ester carboxylesterase